MADGTPPSDARASPSRSVSSSLLERLQAQDVQAWQRLVHLYYPLVRRWGLRAGLQDEDAADLAQEVFRAVAGNVTRFRRGAGEHSFRGWLWGITRKQLLAHGRRRRRQPVGAGGSTAQQHLAEAPEPQDFSAAEQESDRVQLLRRAVALLREKVEEHTWQAFWRVVVEGQAPAEVAADLGISVALVYVAKGRLLARLREEFGDLLE